MGAGAFVRPLTANFPEMFQACRLWQATLTVQPSYRLPFGTGGSPAYNVTIARSESPLRTVWLTFRHPPDMLDAFRHVAVTDVATLFAVP